MLFIGHLQKARWSLHSVAGPAAWQGEGVCCRLWSGSEAKNGDSLSLKAWAPWYIYVSTSQIIAMCWPGSVFSGGKNGELLLLKAPRLEVLSDR